MNRVLQPRPLFVLGLNVWMGTGVRNCLIPLLRPRTVWIDLRGGEGGSVQGQSNQDWGSLREASKLRRFGWGGRTNF